MIEKIPLNWQTNHQKMADLLDLIGDMEDFLEQAKFFVRRMQVYKHTDFDLAHPRLDGVRELLEKVWVKSGLMTKAVHINAGEVSFVVP